MVLVVRWSDFNYLKSQGRVVHRWWVLILGWEKIYFKIRSVTHIYQHWVEIWELLQLIRDRGVRIDDKESIGGCVNWWSELHRWLSYEIKEEEFYFPLHRGRSVKVIRSTETYNWLLEYHHCTGTCWDISMEGNTWTSRSYELTLRISCLVSYRSVLGKRGNLQEFKNLDQVICWHRTCSWFEEIQNFIWEYCWRIIRLAKKVGEASRVLTIELGPFKLQVFWNSKERKQRVSPEDLFDKSVAEGSCELIRRMVPQGFNSEKWS